MKKERRGDRISTYFLTEIPALAAVTVSGLIYNVGLVAVPLFEGKLAGRLEAVIGGSAGFNDMLRLVLIYVAVIALVQVARYVKRFYVRRFGNNVNRRMKRSLYENLVRKNPSELDASSAGGMLTRAVSDVDDCSEGMRKFTTELFDTGIALVAYIVMLFTYDWKLALLCMIFVPLSYFFAEKMKKPVQKAGSAYKKSASALNAATLDRVGNAVTYRVYGCEAQRDAKYGEKLDDYEKKAVKSGMLLSVLPPLYRALTMLSVFFIIIMGAKNVLGTGTAAWDVAAFTTFLSCYTKMAIKSAKSAKLFNSVHKAQISWDRIKDMLTPAARPEKADAEYGSSLHLSGFGFEYKKDSPVFSDVDLELRPGETLGVTGPVASGKSAFGKAFLCELPYLGSARLGERELSSLNESEIAANFAYLGHDPELLNATVEENVKLGRDLDAEELLKLVCLDGEVAQMPDGKNTVVGDGGIRLSGGQGQRLALARTLAQKKPVIILDDPFSALDIATEREIFANMRAYCKNSAIILISHRLYLFPECDRVAFLNNGSAEVGTHSGLLEKNAQYRSLFLSQEGGERQ